MSSCLLEAPAVHSAIARPRPQILGIGGTLRSSSSSEVALRRTLDEAARLGAQTQILTAVDLALPMYDPQTAEGVAAARPLLEAVRRADCIVIATPGYHGGMSGFVKNVLDYLQGLAEDESPYVHNKAVGCIVSASGWQAGAAVLASLRSTVHALRGWPTPLGVSINSATGPFGPAGEVLDPKVGEQIRTLAEQVVGFARVRAAAFA